VVTAIIAKRRSDESWIASRSLPSAAHFRATGPLAMTKSLSLPSVIPGRSEDRTRNLEIPGSSLRDAPE
jgi:hypothetical protein